jgi:hypothetical protein
MLTILIEILTILLTILELSGTEFELSASTLISYILNYLFKKFKLIKIE